jgi:hypothetical protein
MADNKSTQKPARTAASEEEYVEPQWEAPSDRDRSKRRMSEGVRQELVINGFALDPNTGDLLVSDDGENVEVVPRAKAADRIRKLTKELEERRKPATPEGPGL